VQGHHQLLQGGVAGPLADSVDRDLRLARAGADGRERVGRGQPEVVVTSVVEALDAAQEAVLEGRGKGNRSPNDRGLVAKTYLARSSTDPELIGAQRICNRIVKERGVLQARIEAGEPNAETLVEPLGGHRYRLTPRTGRTHQLRVHMAALGVPIDNDSLYPTVMDVAAAGGGVKVRNDGDLAVRKISAKAGGSIELDSVEGRMDLSAEEIELLTV
jgi:hypothetical protein